MSNGRTSSPHWALRFWLTFVTWFSVGVLVGVCGGYILTGFLLKVMAFFHLTNQLIGHREDPPYLSAYLIFGGVTGSIVGVGWWVWQGASRDRFWLASLLWLSAGMVTGGIAGVIIGVGSGIIRIWYLPGHLPTHTLDETIELYCRMYGYYFLGATVGYAIVRILHAVSRMWQDEPPAHDTGQTGEGASPGLDAPTGVPDQRRFAAADRVPTRQEAHTTRAHWPHVFIVLMVLAAILGGGVSVLLPHRVQAHAQSGTEYPHEVLWKPRAPEIVQKVDVYGPHALLHQMPDLVKYLDLDVGDERDWAVKHIFEGSMTYSQPYADLVRLRSSPLEDWPKILKKYSRVGRSVMAKLALGGLMLHTRRGVFPYPPMSPPEPGETTAQYTARAMAYAADLAGKGDRDWAALAGTTGAELLSQVATPKALAANIALAVGTGVAGNIAARSLLGAYAGLLGGTVLGVIYGAPPVVRGVREVQKGEIGVGAAHILGGCIQVLPAALGALAGVRLAARAARRSRGDKERSAHP